MHQGQGFFRVETIKDGDGRVDTSKFGEISWITRGTDSIELSRSFTDDDGYDRFYIKSYKVEHRNLVVTKNKAKETENSNNNNLGQDLISDYAGKMTISPGQNLSTTNDYKLELLEFLGLGKIANYGQHNLQVKTIKVGNKLIDASNEKEISWISRDDDTLVTYAYDKQCDNYYAIISKVDHCNLRFIAGGYIDCSSEDI